MLLWEVFSYGRVPYPRVVRSKHSTEHTSFIVRVVYDIGSSACREVEGKWKNVGTHHRSYKILDNKHNGTFSCLIEGHALYSDGIIWTAVWCVER